MQLTRPIIEDDFFSAGKPTWQTARVGIECIDISNGYKYIQRTRPYGNLWEKVSEYNIVEINNSSGDDSLLLMGG